MRYSPMRRKTSLSGATILGWLTPATCRPVWVNSVGGSNGSGGGAGANSRGPLSGIAGGGAAPQIDSSVGSELVTDVDGCPLAASLLSASAAVTTRGSAAGLGAGSANGLGAADAEGATG